MEVGLPELETMTANNASSLLLRIYLVDFAMNVLPVASIDATAGGSSVVHTATPGTLRLGQRPGYCSTSPDEDKCTPAIWLLNTMRFTMPGQFAINTLEGSVYYWPALASRDVSDVSVS